MKAFVIDSGVRIAPFGDLARDLPVGGVRLSDLQDRLLRRFGLEPVRVATLEEVPTDQARLVLYDNVYFTRRVLKSFLERWRARGMGASRLALPLESTFIARFSALQDYERGDGHALFNLMGFPAGAGSHDPCAPLPVIYKEKVISLPTAGRIVGVDTWIHPITSSVALHVRHWLHVLQANLLSIQVRWVDEVIASPIWAASVALRGLIPGRGKLMWRIARRANRFGRGVDVHPTALVEASFLGDGVTVGPGAIVRGAIIGAGCTVEQGADVSFSVIGERCFVSKHSIVYATAAMEQSDLCMKGMQMCLVGARVALTARASPIDTAPGDGIRVRDGEYLKVIDLPVLGSCYGHDTFIGADVFIGAGRAIPNGVRIGPSADRVLSIVPERLVPGTYAIKKGALVAT